MSKINEKELREIFKQLKNDNQNIFEELYNKYYKLVYGIAFCILKNKEDAEDVTQTVFTKIHTVDKNKLPISNEASWLYSTTKNEALTVLRKRNNNIELDDIFEIQAEDNKLNEIIDKDSFNRLISKLDNKEKEIISLKIIGNLSFEQIGKILNEPTGTIKWRYYKAKNTLKLLLSNLSMFIISFIAGVKILSTKSQENISHDNFKDEEISQDNVIENLPSYEDNKSNSIQESQDRVEIDEEEEKQETIIQEPEKEDINYVGLGIISISAIFFIITIFFTIIFTKYQLKRKIKSSK